MENNQPKKKNAGLTALIALLLIITTIASCIGIYAWAKYISSQNGSANAQVAKWNFNVNLKKGQNTVVLGSEPIDLATTMTHVADNRIAPGTSGTFDIEINTTGTEVDLQYEVAISLENCPRNITFSRKTGESGGQDVFTPISAGGASNSADLTRTGITFSEYVANDAQQRVYTERIKWDWPYSDANDADYDTRDNLDESALNDSNPKKIVTMNITVTGTEMTANPNAAPANSVQGQAQAGNVHVGDSVNYNPGDLTTTTASIKLPEGATIEGSKLASVSLPNGTGLFGEINAASAGDWEVLDVNTQTGEVLIFPRTYSQTRLLLQGKSGYNNAIEALNEVASIYLNPTYAISARSLTVDDVNKREDHTPDGNVASETMGHRYGVDSNLNITDTGSDEYTPDQTYTSTTETGYYSYTTSNFSGMSCWLASRCLDVNSSGCYFGVRNLGVGDVYYSNYLFDVYSDGSSYTDYSCFPVVPVVSLKSNIQMEKVNDVWMLNGDSSTYTAETPIEETGTPSVSE